MIKSMTGFGRGEAQDSHRQFTVEIKTVNHRYNDIVVRMPKRLTYLEERIKEQIKGEIKRGRVEIFITQENIGQSDVRVALNIPLVEQYHNALNEIKDIFKVQDDITVSLLSRFPDVLALEAKEENEDEVWKCLNTAIQKALAMLVKMRLAEGHKLTEDILDKCDYISKIVDKVNERAPSVVSDYKLRLKERLADLLDETIQVDENRINMEIAVFADKCSIDEEIVRLRSHVNQLKKACHDQNPIGRKLDFLIQEMNREVNTIGSKASDLEIINDVVEIKSELEKIREQVQNIE